MTARHSVRLGAALCVLLMAVPRGLAAQEAPRVDVVVVVQGLRTDTGLLRGALFSDAGSWLREGNEASVCRASVRRGQARCAFHRLPAGRYGFAFFHDEDGDRSFDRDWIGMPQEGFGFSRQARGAVRNLRGGQMILLVATARLVRRTA